MIPRRASRSRAPTRWRSSRRSPRRSWEAASSKSFSYDAIGNRQQSVDHAIGSSGTNVTTGYTNGCTANCNSTGAQPHTLTATTGGTNPTTFGYDENGNLHTRTPTTGPSQTLTWDDEGHLAQVDTSGSSPTTTKYLYDADGNQLIRRDPGQTTLFVGDTEIVVNTSVTPNVLLGAVRIYTHGGAGTPVAVHSSLGGGSVKYLFNDPNGTATLSMDTTTQQVARQQYTPYGQPRASANTTTWPDPTHTYLGKPQDTTTGYTDVGARKYDPTLGRFISADPLLQPTSPQSLGGYTYASDNPVTNSDPSGLMACQTPDECGGGAQYGNNTPTRNSGGKALNDASWGCNGCDVVNSSNSDPNNQGEVDASKRRAASAAFHKKYMEIYPQVFIPRNWKYANQFAKIFNEETDTACRDFGWDCLADPQDAAEAEADQHIITHLKFLTCMALGHGTGCLGKTGTSIGVAAAAIFALTGGGGEGPGGGFRGKGLGGGKCSFSPDTPVLMAKGRTKPIGKIKPGDKVESADPTTAKDKGARTVQHVWINHDNDLLDVIINTGHGRTEIIHTTSNHPFYDATTRTWVPAGSLKPGDHLASVHDQPTTVVRVHGTPGAANRYNLTVEQLHTYYVLAGQTPVLVHNSGAGPDPTSFSNLIPEDTPEWFKPIAPGTVLSRSGNYAYVVTGDGELVIGKRTAGHVSLAQGRDVLAAGEFKTKGGQVVYLDNKSGHYQPYGANAQKAAVDAFDRNGLDADGKYIEAWRPSC
ncbi:polymorphic toxin-type HINT domain-containing protein [Streptomyces sp. NPDC007162]|uniref:polymorphic toxin-type HINT domain-containing protein n=1 Tax=Streptomyces sp. NPDC007162 TaxID=3156917 RepID=UPI0033DB4A09